MTDWCFAKIPFGCSWSQLYSHSSALHPAAISLWQSLSGLVTWATFPWLVSHSQLTTASCCFLHVPHDTHFILLPKLIWTHCCYSESHFQVMSQLTSYPCASCDSPTALPFKLLNGIVGSEAFIFHGFHQPQVTPDQHTLNTKCSSHVRVDSRQILLLSFLIR